MSQWYYAHNEEQLGPVSAAALKEMAQKGKLDRGDLIWREGMQRWAPAYKVRGLFPESSDNAKLAESDGTSLVSQGPADVPAKECDERQGDVATGSGEQDKESDSVSADEETAIDALPLGGPEESKLHVPALGAPDKGGDSHKSRSDNLVVFEPTVAPPAPPARPTAPASNSSSPAETSKQDSTTQQQTRIDLPSQAIKTNWKAGSGLFLQTFTWMTCLLVILVGGVAYLGSLMVSSDSSQRLSASCIYMTFVVASYFLARSTDRLLRTLGSWFSTPSAKQMSHDVRQRNWSRFQ